MCMTDWKEMKGVNPINQNQYKCDSCGATFTSQEELNEHKRNMHSQHNCEVCGQSFSSENELETHKRVAHPERQGTPNR
jgi:uncharacterized Zn-finger protein